MKSPNQFHQRKTKKIGHLSEMNSTREFTVLEKEMVKEKVEELLRQKWEKWGKQHAGSGYLSKNGRIYSSRADCMTSDVRISTQNKQS